MKRTPSSSWKKRSDPVTAYYGYQKSVTGSCGSVSADTDFVVGLPKDYVTSEFTDNCGAQVTVALASDSSKSISATVADTCDCAPGAIYLSIAAFEALSGGSLDEGVLNVTWEFDFNAPAVDIAPPSSSIDATDIAPSTSVAVPTISSSAVPIISSSAAEETTSFVPETTSIETPTSTSSYTAPASTGGTSSDGWTNTQYLTGNALFDAFNFDTGAADNAGAANYVGRDSGLVYTDGDGNAVIAVDTTEYVGLRNSVRMVSAEQLDVGFMMIVDIKAMPAGCGMWPAIWLNGACDAGWPACGEIDLVEGVNLYTQNVVSIHTDGGCSVPSTLTSLANAVLKVPTTLSCDANVDPASCGWNDNSEVSYGAPFNAAGGGVYAVSVTEAGIDFFFFSRPDVPGDILSNTPTPSGWGTPLVSIPNWECNIGQHFQKLNIIINTNLAGTFGEGVWHGTGNGQTVSCADQTGFGSAFEYVTQNGHAFNSPWVIKSLGIYKQN
ncbi:hypothetical protein BDZ89DRAFT_1133746 [Hymenopellis radicata]|nr:hypothetical protein BDZ89DRAFT_1133746 [Hymenopellis radicata]